MNTRKNTPPLTSNEGEEQLAALQRHTHNMAVLDQAMCAAGGAGLFAYIKDRPEVRDLLVALAANRVVIEAYYASPKEPA